MEHIRYIDKTREYYRREGYESDYMWAEFDTGPLTPLARPLAGSRVAIVTTASLVQLDDTGRPLEPARLLGTRELEVFPLPADVPPWRLRCTSEDHDRAQTNMSDLDAFYPATRLQELARDGVIGEVAPEHLRILPNYSQRKVVQVDALEVLQRCREHAVDIALLTPI